MMLRLPLLDSAIFYFNPGACYYQCLNPGENTNANAFCKIFNFIWQIQMTFRVMEFDILQIDVFYES